MKHLITLCALVLTQVPAWAYHFEADGVYYNKLSGGKTVEVTYRAGDYNSYSGRVTIPSTVTYDEVEYAVTSIGTYAFRDCLTLTSVQLPECLTNIGQYAFMNCSGLQGIDIPEGVTNVQAYAFQNCTGMTEIVVPDGVTTLGAAVFSGCTSLRSANIPEGVTQVSGSLFLNCAGLESIDIPTGVTVIGASAFQGCAGLREVVIPEGVTMLPNSLFYGCTNLQSVKIPTGVVRIGDSVFYNCTALTCVEIPAGVMGMGNSVFYNCQALTGIELPEGIPSLGTSVFYGCTGLTSMVVPEGVNSINSNAFYGCSALQSVRMPLRLKALGASAFQGCSKLTSIVVPEGVTSIGNNAFYNCAALQSVALPEGVTTIGNSVFYGCTSLTSIELPATLRSLGSSVFYNCNRLTSVSLPDGVKGIGASAFQSCTSLTTVAMPAAATSIGNNAFYSCTNLGAIEIPAGVNLIGANAFYNCTSLSTITARPVSAPTLGNATAIPTTPLIYVPAAGLEDYMTAPNWSDHSIQMVAQEAQTEWTVTTVAQDNISSLFQEIGDANLNNVVSLKVSGTINSYDIIIMRGKMGHLRHLDLSDATIVGCSKEYVAGYCTHDNVIERFALPAQLVSLVLPNTLTEVGANAFNGFKSLKSVSIPASVKTIYASAFAGCTGLKRADFASIESLCGIKFTDAASNPLASSHHLYVDGVEVLNVSIPTTATSIGQYAFYGASAITSVDIPATVTSIGKLAFSGCTALEDIYNHAIEPLAIDQNTFDNTTYQKATLHVPAIAFNSYYFEGSWSQFNKVLTFEDNVDYLHIANDFTISTDTTGPLAGKPNVDIDKNGALIVEGSSLQELGTLRVMYDVFNQKAASIIANGNLTADQLYIEIDTRKDYWHFLSFPYDVDIASIVKSGNYIFRYYDGTERATNGMGGWRDVEDNILRAGQGYIFCTNREGILRIPVAAPDLSGSTQVKELAKYGDESSAEADKNWNFVGNPYLAYYDINAMDYTAPIVVWDGSKNYVAYRPGDDHFTLMPYQAFFVQCPPSVDGISFSPEGRLTGNQQSAATRSMKPTQSQERCFLNLTLSDGEFTDQCRVVINEAKSSDYEMDCDAAKFFTSEQVPQVYTIDAAGAQYAINERPLQTGQISLGIVAPHDGQYTLRATRMDMPAFILDSHTGQTVDLAEGYTFITTAGTHNTRFTLSVGGGAEGISLESLAPTMQGAAFDLSGRPLGPVFDSATDKSLSRGLYIMQGEKKIIQ